METPAEPIKKKNSTKRPIGGLLVADGLITADQLQQALKFQSQVGGHIGSILTELGFITVENLLYFLGKQIGVSAVNLFKINVKPEVINQVPLDKIKTLRILPVTMDERTITLAMENVQDIMTISELEFSLRKQVKPVLAASFMMDAAIRSLAANPVGGFKGEDCRALTEAERKSIRLPPQLTKLLNYLMKSGASDMLLTAGAPPSVRMSNELKRLAMVPLDPEDCEGYARDLMGEDEWERFLKRNEYDFSMTYPGVGRFRVNAFKQRSSISLSLRPVLETLPTLKKLNLPDWLEEHALMNRGLILISGPQGHGKTSTLAALVDVINSNRYSNILMLEDPIEFFHVHKKSNVNQREIGRDTESYAEAFKHIFRQSPDVIVIGELRTPETFEAALTAADNGCMVLGTVNGSTSTSTVQKIIDMFEPHRRGYIQTLLVDNLILALSQRLVPQKEEPGRALALETLVMSKRVAGLIREGRIYRIRSQSLTETEDFISIDLSLAALCKGGVIEFDDGLVFAEDKDHYEELVGEATASREG
ncbi:MAG: PilT/PilU family type 4a pilus ATPase [Desulfobacterales bacterium]|nr:PilT/PilU family type 4a pilus ATPase [Desulfobacterales bacterium]